MKRFILLALPLCFTMAHIAPAQEEVDNEQAPVVRARRGDGPRVQRPAPQAPVQRSLPAAVQRPQSFRAAGDIRPSRANYDPDVSVQPGARPRIHTPQLAERVRQPRVFSPPHPSVAAPAPVQTTQPAPAAEPSTDARIRSWTGHGGRGRTGGHWGTRGSVEGNQDWRNRAEAEGTTEEHARHGGRRSWRERHREWHKRHEGDPNFAQAHRRWHRQHQSRDWWRSRYSRFALFGGGYYYWNAGYWYPAYGYDPYLCTYTYNAPIYAYNDMDPGEIIASVQQELQRLGYYRGALDGTYGPLTRWALLNYQRDTGLPVTGEIDQTTLASLGFE